LKHCIDRMSALNSESALQMSDLPSSLQNLVAADELGRLALAVNGSAPSKDELPEMVLAPVSPVISLSQSERQAIENALAVTHGERGKAARLLGIGRTTLCRKMKQYVIE
jgi:two-component system response regulator HydG